MKKMRVIILLSIMFFSSISSASAQGEKEYVVLLHGIARSSSHMQPLAGYLTDAGYVVVNLDYPSTDYTLKELVAKVDAQVQLAIPTGYKVHFIGYSMGGLLVRALIHQHRPQHLGRVVLLATPNQGSEVADFLQDNALYQWVYGPAGQELTTGNDKTAKLLGTVDYELGVIAGNSTIDPLSSYIIPGDDDGKVSIVSTKLDGMTDHIVVDASHFFFPSNEEVHKQTLHFLMEGEFYESKSKKF